MSLCQKPVEGRKAVKELFPLLGPGRVVRDLGLGVRGVLIKEQRVGLGRKTAGRTSRTVS